MTSTDDWTPEQTDEAVSDDLRQARAHANLDEAGLRTSFAGLADHADRDDVGLLDAAIPGAYSDRSHLRRESIADRYVIDEGRLEAVLGVLEEHAPHLLLAADRDPLEGVEPGDMDMTSGSSSCSSRSWPDPLADGHRWPCTRGRHPRGWTHITGDGRQVLVVWRDDSTEQEPQQ